MSLVNPEPGILFPFHRLTEGKMASRELGTNDDSKHDMALKIFTVVVLTLVWFLRSRRTVDMADRMAAHGRNT